MEFQKAMQELKRGTIHPIYVLVGTELFLQEQFTDLLFSQLGNKSELDVTHFDLEEHSMDEILDEADMFSFFSDYRIVMIDNVQFLATHSKQKLTDTQQKRLLSYIQEPNTASIIVFKVEMDSIDKRRKISKALLKETAYVDVTPLNESQVENYVQGYIRNASLNMTREAVNELLIRTNFQLTQIMSEIKKLTSFATTGHPITIDVIRQLVPRTLESDVFELTNAVVNLQVDRASQIYEDLLLMKHEPIALHALLSSQFRLFIQTRILAKNGYREGDIAKQLGVHPYRVKLAMQNNRNLSLDQLMLFYNELVTVDYSMKTGIGIKETYFYILLTKLVEIINNH